MAPSWWQCKFARPPINAQPDRTPDVFDPVVAKLEADNARLRVLIEAQAEKLRAQEILIAELRSRLEELQAHIAQDSATSSLPPSRDRTDRRARRGRRAAEAKERREARGAGGGGPEAGKQKGAPGSTLPRRIPSASWGTPPTPARSAGRTWPERRWWELRAARC
jgi:hypothetical protein